MQQHVYIIFPQNIYSEFEQVLLISFLDIFIGYVLISHTQYTHALTDVHKYHSTNYCNLSYVTCCYLLKNSINISSYVCEDTTCSDNLRADRSMCS